MELGLVGSTSDDGIVTKLPSDRTTRKPSRLYVLCTTSISDISGQSTDASCKRLRTPIPSSSTTRYKRSDAIAAPKASRPMVMVKPRIRNEGLEYKLTAAQTAVIRNSSAVCQGGMRS